MNRTIYQNNNYKLVDNNSFQPYKNKLDYNLMVNPNDNLLYPPAGDVNYKNIPTYKVISDSQNGVRYINTKAVIDKRNKNQDIFSKPNPVRFF